MLSSEEHTHNTEDDLVVLKTVKGKGKKRVRESARIRELFENNKKSKMYKTEVGPIAVEKTMNDIFLL